METIIDEDSVVDPTLDPSASPSRFTLTPYASRLLDDGDEKKKEGATALAEGMASSCCLISSTFFVISLLVHGHVLCKGSRSYADFNPFPRS